MNCVPGFGLMKHKTRRTCDSDAIYLRTKNCAFSTKHRAAQPSTKNISPNPPILSRFCMNQQALSLRRTSQPPALV